MGLINRLKQIPEGVKNFFNRTTTSGVITATLEGAKDVGTKNVAAVRTIGQDVKGLR